MEQWSTNKVKVALQRYVREGNSRDWDQALESAGGESLLLALAEQMQHTGEPDLILIVRRLAREAGHRRADLAQSFRSGVLDASAEEGYHATLFQLMDLIKEGASRPGKPGSREELMGRINKKVDQGCNTLDISGRVRKDLLASDLDEDALGDKSLVDVLVLRHTEVVTIARDLRAIASPGDRRRLPPAARRARLMLQAAKLLLVAPRPEDRAQEIHHAIGAYCCRQAQVYSDDRHDTDAAQDYALEAVRYQGSDPAFPAALYFYTALVQFNKQYGLSVIPKFRPEQRAEAILGGMNVLFPRHTGPVPLRREEPLRILGLALLRLALHVGTLPLQIFGLLAPTVQQEYLRILSGTLGVPLDAKENALQQFDSLVGRYRQRMTALHDALKHAAHAASLKEVGNSSAALEGLTGEARLLVSFAEQEAIKEIVQAAVRARQAADEADPAKRRALLRAARDSLNRAQDHGRSLSFGILHIDPLVQGWRQVIDQDFEETLRLIRPQLSLRPYKNTLLRRGRDGLVQLQLRNVGRGVATALEVTASWLGRPLQEQLEYPHLSPDQDALLTLAGPLEDDVREVEVSVEVSCTDAEGSRRTFPTETLLFKGPPPDFDFEEKRQGNPFNAGDVVKDPNMFMGRDNILQQLQDVVAAEDHHGVLRLLFGQKRVGKSSILHFLEQRLNALERPLAPNGVSGLLG